jgi:hypothetical protein
MKIFLCVAFGALVLFFWWVDPAEFAEGELLDDIADQIRQWDAWVNAAAARLMEFIRGLF